MTSKRIVGLGANNACR